LLLSYLISAAGLVLLSFSSALWHFWVAVALTGLSFSIGSTVGQALANDLIPRESLGRGLGLFGATSWMGAIVGFAGTGQAVQHLGLTPTLIAGATLPLISILLLAPVRQVKDPSA
jgi:MFS family permease